MQILEHPHTWQWCRERGILNEHEEVPRLDADSSLVRVSRVVFAPDAPPGDPQAVADSIQGWLAEWEECLVWLTSWGAWPSSEDWPEYYAWRARHGMRLSVDDAPGHLARADDRTDLRELLRLIIKNGWDAWIIPSVGIERPTVRVRVSHDGWAEHLGTTAESSGRATSKPS